MPNPLENVAARAAGQAAAFRARAQGLTGVFAILVEQHREASLLLARAAGVDDVDERRELWVTIRRELLSHERGELEVVYPTLERNAATHDIALRHSEEAATIAELDRAGCESPRWPSLLQRLITAVQQHIDEEEHEFFPRAGEAIGREQAADLVGPFMATKERVLETIR